MRISTHGPGRIDIVVKAVTFEQDMELFTSYCLGVVQREERTKLTTLLATRRLQLLKQEQAQIEVNRQSVFLEWDF